jgi:PTS system nitrogen regulatory IIA component
MITDLLPPEAVLHGVSAADKPALLAMLASHAAQFCAIDAACIAEAVNARELLGTTGFGGGIAIPHARLAGLDHMVAVFATLATPVDYGALDGAPVDLVVLLLAPIEAGAEPLKALARISRLLRDAALVEKLRAAPSAEALAKLLGVGVAVQDRAA